LAGLALGFGDTDASAIALGGSLLAVGDALANVFGDEVAETLPLLLQLVSKMLTAKKELRIQRNIFIPLL